VNQTRRSYTKWSTVSGPRKCRDKRSDFINLHCHLYSDKWRCHRKNVAAKTSWSPALFASNVFLNGACSHTILRIFPVPRPYPHCCQFDHCTVLFRSVPTIYILYIYILYIIIYLFIYYILYIIYYILYIIFGFITGIYSPRLYTSNNNVIERQRIAEWLQPAAFASLRCREYGADGVYVLYTESIGWKLRLNIRRKTYALGTISYWALDKVQPFTVIRWSQCACAAKCDGVLRSCCSQRTAMQVIYQCSLCWVAVHELTQVGSIRLRLNDNPLTKRLSFVAHSRKLNHCRPIMCWWGV